MSSGQEAQKPKAKKDPKKDRSLTEAELERVSGGVEPINGGPRKAEPALPRKAEPITD